MSFYDVQIGLIWLKVLEFPAEPNCQLTPGFVMRGPAEQKAGCQEKSAVWLKWHEAFKGISPSSLAQPVLHFKYTPFSLLYTACSLLVFCGNDC